MEINSRVVTLRKENSTIAKPAQYCFLSRKNIEVGGFFFILNLFYYQSP